MSGTFTKFEVTDVRMPTSETLVGSDAMNPDPDYSAAYLQVHTSSGESGFGFIFTIGRGNDVAVAAIRALEERVVGLDVETACADLRGLWQRLVYDSQIRWLGPECGVTHMAIGAVVNAVWDLHARRLGKPLWKVLADMPPEELISVVDFRHISDAITPGEALDLLKAAADGKSAREAKLLSEGFPAYTTSAGWLGYSDEKVSRLVNAAITEGFTHLKIKVGSNLDDDVRRVGMVRELVGLDVTLSLDANQRWDVDEAIAAMARLSKFDVEWIEEPTHPHDILGHRAIAQAIAPIAVATGEHAANRILFKQLLASDAIGVCQIDACRVAGINENLAILLLAAKYGKRVCPHAGGVGLCEVVQHIAMFDFVALGGSLDRRWIEHVPHLHEHFVQPVHVENGQYLAPTAPGSGAQMMASSVADFTFPTGRIWAHRHAAAGVE